jgi:hypothetical protein
MPHDAKAFLSETDNVRGGARKESVIGRTAGIIKVNGPVLDAEELREVAAQAIAEDGIRRGEFD